MGRSGLGVEPVRMRPLQRWRAFAAMCGLMLSLASGPQDWAGAAEWSAEPSLSVKGEYNSNLLLFDGNNQVWGQWVSPGVTWKGATESLEVQGSMKGDFVRYQGANDRELTNLYFPLRVSYQRDRQAFACEGGFTRDNTLLGELRQTGLVLGFTQRNLWTAAPTWTVGLTERLSWQVGYQFMDATYQNGRRFGLVDFRVHGGTSAMLYRPTERDLVQLNAEVTNFDTPAIRQEFAYYGGGFRLTHSFSESMSVTASAGVRRVESVQRFDGGELSDRTITWLYGGELRKEFERTSLSLGASREVNPSGFGFLLQTDRFGGTVVHRINESVTVSLDGAVYLVDFSTSPLLGAAFPQTRFSSVSPKVSWKFGQWWWLDVGYTYAERAVDGLHQWNFSNSSFITLTYRGAKLSVSQ